MVKLLRALLIGTVLIVIGSPLSAQTPTMQNYTAFPPFVNQTVPPLVMLVLDKDHRMFLKAYNDITDLDNDGVIETTYKDSVQYDGYFDWTKCYTYNGSASPSGRFEPVTTATGTNGHYCSANWSGNFLNWATMARIDVLRKVVYGGHRTVDTASTTVLSRTLLPRDGHSWAKVYSGTDIASLTPFTWSNITLCNTNTSGTETSGKVMAINGNFPYAASTENQQCLWQYNNSSSYPFGPALNGNNANPQALPALTYNTDVLVCVSAMVENNCQTYTDTSNVNHYKPTGLMQQMGVDRQGTATTADDVIFMKFALITGSYGANEAGGVLRSNVTDVNQEIDPATGMIKATSQIIANMDRIQILQYSYAPWNPSTGAHGGWYYGSATATSNVAGYNCFQSEILDLSTVATGICESWGNPMAEMFFEAVRYFMGKSRPTDKFQVSPPDDSLLGMTVASSWVDAYSATGGNCPYCSKPFILLLSDPRPSYDSNQLPGSYWYSAISSGTDVPSVQTLMANAQIDTLEGIGTVYIGQSGSTFDRACTPKTASFASIRGLCIEEPTKQGAYYMAGLANYAKTTDLRGDVQGSQTITTYAVVSNPPFPTLTFPVGSKQVQIIPDFHDGCPSGGWGNDCSGGQGANGDNSGGEIVDFQLCFNDADWTAEQGNGFTSCYDLMWDDADQGWDYELDVRMRIYVKTTASTITVKTKGLYGAAGHTDYAGYFINGVVGAGQYLDLTCGGDAGFTDCDAYTIVNSSNNGMGDSVTTRTFTVGGATAQVLNDPFWYAAKYGGFTDKNGNNIPDQPSEWDADGNGIPDTYFYTSNPLQLQTQLGAAFVSILAKAASGTAVSVLANSSTGAGALYQAYFNPTTFDTSTLSEVKWVGYLQNLFLDQYGNLREDTDGDGRLIYQNDYIIQTQYDSNSNSPTFGQVLVSKFVDANGDGQADSPTPTLSGLHLSDLRPVWEGGKQLAMMAPSARRLLTWVDPNNNGLVDPGEQIVFGTATDTQLAPYLRPSATPFTTDNIINFIAGTQVPGLRNRQLTVGGAVQVWKLGDIIDSTPTLVAAPHERYDVIYGDASYQTFYQQYRSRRQVVYAGANDGMLHAFNAGFYNVGDDPNTPTQTEHGWFTTQRVPPLPPATNTPVLGQELWGFIPMHLLPHLRWLADPNYSHVYYVDLKPKVTDVRIFCDTGGGAPSTCISGQTTSHPNGWGTILIGGFRMGGSCGACTPGTGAPPMTVNADFNNDGNTTDPNDTRTFYSAYFILDITDPEVDPKLIWVFSAPGLGLTTSYPTIVRSNPFSDAKTSATNTAWYVLFGSGPTGYSGSVVQTSTLYTMNLITGPGPANTLITAMPVSAINSWMGDFAALDKDLDFRTDVVYAGTVMNSGSPPWRGKLYRLTTGSCASGPCSVGSWGIASGGTRVPTEVVDVFPSGGSITTGPITAAPGLTRDDSNNIWLFFGTGRFYSPPDKTNTETQYLFGIKDSVLSGGCSQTSVTSCWNNNLVNVSAATICIASCTGSQVSGVPGGITTLLGSNPTTTLQGLIQSKDGWYTTLPTAGERSLSSPTVIGGTAFFTTFTPVTDICSSAGNGNLYALFYLTGTASTSPILGTTSSGSSSMATRSISIGSTTGIASQMAVQIGSQGSGAGGSTTAGAGCQGRVTGLVQSSTGTLTSTCINVGNPWSRYISWINQRL